MSSTCKFEKEMGGGVIMPGLPNELALGILASLPRILQARLRLVCRSWNDAMEPLSLNTLRKSLGIFEVWPFFADESMAADGYKKVFSIIVNPVPQYIFSEHTCPTHLPKVQEIGIPPPPQLHQYPDLFEFRVFSATGSKVLLTAKPCHESVDHLQGIYVFDASSMRWTDCVYPNWRNNFDFGFVTAIDAQGGYVYVTSGSRNHFDRLDCRRGVWEALPSRHMGRDCAAVVVLQGCLYVIGGLKNDVPGHALQPYYSGEVWDPSTREWTVRPELWPAEVFRGESRARAAVVRDQLFALRGEFPVEELMHYQLSSKNWISLGSLPADAHDNTYHYDLNLCAKGEELWMFDDCLAHLAARPSSVSQPACWRVLSSIVQNVVRYYGTLIYSNVLLV